MGLSSQSVQLLTKKNFLHVIGLNNSSFFKSEYLFTTLFQEIEAAGEAVVVSAVADLADVKGFKLFFWIIKTSIFKGKCHEEWRRY